jgi:hypothetical protein
MAVKDYRELMMEMRKRLSSVAVFAVFSGGKNDARCRVGTADVLGARGFCKAVLMERFLSSVRADLVE